MMQAFITEDGKLTIIPETDAEAFALRMWNEANGVLVTEWRKRIDSFGNITMSSLPKKEGI